MPTTGKDEGHWTLADWEARLLGDPAPAVFTSAPIKEKKSAATAM